VKAALQLMGFSVGEPRLPLLPATAAELASVQAVMQELKLL